MKHIIFTLLLFVSSYALADVNVPDGFEKHDSIVYQISAGKQWLSPIFTINRSYQNVSEDISNDTGQFKRSDGWRYPTEQEFKELIYDWFSIPGFTITYKEYPFGESEDLLVEQFVHAFGDNDVAHQMYINANFNKPNLCDIRSGYVSGIIHMPARFSYGQKMHIATVLDGDKTCITNEFYLEYENIDLNDEVSLANKQSINIAEPNVGSFLVRDVILTE